MLFDSKAWLNASVFTSYKYLVSRKVFLSVNIVKAFGLQWGVNAADDLSRVAYTAKKFGRNGS